MKIKKISAVIFAVMMALLTLSPCAFAENGSRFEFDSDGKFTILHISDPQDDQYPAHKLEDFITKAIETADPDFIVITGDIVEDWRFGDIGTDDKNFQEGVVVDGDYEATLENVKTAVNAVFSPIEKSGIYYAVTQGNNDYKSGISNEDWLKIYQSYPHCIVVDESDDEEGKIDSYIEINKHMSDEAAFGIWLLDNAKGFKEGQKNWFKNKETSGVPSIVFEHIPIKDIGNLFEKCHIWDSGALLGDGGFYRLNGDVAKGVNYNVVEPSDEPSEVFKMWKDKGVTGAFFGDYHFDGYTGVYDGITLGLTYGFEFSKPGPYGMRVIELDEDGTFETDLYTYSKAKNEFTLQEDKTVSTDNFVFSILGGVFNTVTYIFRQISAWLKF